MNLKLDGGRIRKAADDAREKPDFVVEQRNGEGWDRIEIPNAVAVKMARFIIKHGASSQHRHKCDQCGLVYDCRGVKCYREREYMCKCCWDSFSD